jgi:hypothetical protein
MRRNCICRFCSHDPCDEQNRRGWVRGVYDVENSDPAIARGTEVTDEYVWREIAQRTAQPAAYGDHPPADSFAIRRDSTGLPARVVGVAFVTKFIRRVGHRSIDEGALVEVCTDARRTAVRSSVPTRVSLVRLLLRSVEGYPNAFSAFSMASLMSCARFETPSLAIRRLR